MKILRYILFLLLVWFFSFHIEGQSNYIIHHYSKKELPEEGMIKNISIDSNDRVIITTNRKQFFFDGENFVPIENKIDQILQQTNFKFRGPLYIGNNKKLYYSTLNGLLLTNLEGNELKRIWPGGKKCELGPNKINKVLVDNDGKIWLVSYRNGLYVWDINNNCIQHILIENIDINESNIEIRRIYKHKYNKDLLVLAHVRGVSFINIKTFEINNIYTNTSFEPTKVKFLNKKHLLAGTWFNGVYDINLNTKQAKRHVSPTLNEKRLDEDQLVKDIVVLNDSTAYIAFFSQGIFKYKNGKLKNIINSSNQLKGKVKKIMISEDKTIWILHKNSLSVAIKQKQHFNHIIPIKKSRYLLKSPLNDYYLSGGSGNEVIKFDMNFKVIKKYSVQNLKYKANGKNTLFATFYKNKPYFSGYNTLFKLDEEKNMIIPWKNDVFDPTKDITEPRGMITFNNKLIIPTKRGGIIEIDMLSESVRKYHINDSSFSHSPNWHFFRDLKIDMENRLWITSENGVTFTKDTKRYTYFNRRSIDNHGKMIGLTDRIAISNDGKVWFLNDQMQIMYWDNDKVFDTGQKIEGKTIYSATCDDNDMLWILTNNNLVKYNPKNNKITKWGKYLGFNSSGYKRLSILSDSILCVTGKNGHLLVNTKTITNTVISTMIDFIYYQIENNPIIYFDQNTQKDILLPYKNNKLSISFLNKIHFPISGIIIQYRLNKSKWKNLDKNILEFHNLGSGNYTIDMRSEVLSNLNQAKIKSITFAVETPFYRSWLFYYSFPIIMFIGIWLFFRTRAIQSRKKAKIETERLMAEEKLKSEFKQKIANLEMQNLQVQMNPHFIFNSINSLKRMIMVSDIEKGLEYLQKFSTMVRLILHNSRKKLITLEEEMQLLKLYLAFESLRFTSRFEYSIDIESSIDPSFIDLPPMILQPFIENAIWHGLLHLENRSPKLSIEFYPEKDDLICKITDNGIGRKASLKNTKSTHKSLGTTITNERLKVYEKITGKTISFKYIDLYENNITDSSATNISVGTQVVIRLEDNI